MAYKIVGILKVLTNLRVHNYHVGNGVKLKNYSTVYKANTNGAVTVPNIITKPEVDALLKDLPLSQYGALDGQPLALVFQSSKVTIKGTVPLFMSGQYFELPETILDSNLVATPANPTVYVYVQLKLGVPQYTMSPVEIPETETTMYIGYLYNSTGAITSNTLSKVSRFDKYRNSLTQQGSSFPVSSGNPTQPGSIAW